MKIPPQLLLALPLLLPLLVWLLRE